MPMSPEEFYAHAMRAADDEGRLPLSRMAGWEVFPFEPEGLLVVPLVPPVLPEPPRAGENAGDCRACLSARAGRLPVWSDANWRLSAFGQSGSPLILILEPIAHHDLPDLPDPLAAEMGLLVVRIVRAIESLPHIARAHVSRWGDGGAHLHLFFFARPAGFAQLRGTCLAIWDDLLPAIPASQRDEDAAAVGEALSALMGQGGGRRPGGFRMTRMACTGNQGKTGAPRPAAVIADHDPPPGTDHDPPSRGIRPGGASGGPNPVTQHRSRQPQIRE